jgi:predicted transcriptional regulator
MPTDAELDILAAIWRLGPSTVRDVHEHLGKTRGYTTTLKQMQVMLEKRLIARTERFGSHVYESSVPQEETQNQIAGHILRRAFNGSATNLMLRALSAQPASPEDLKDIRRMLDEYEKREGAK